MDQIIRKTIIKSHFLFFLSLISIVSIEAQTNFKDKESFLEAESDFLYEDFAEALPVYIQLKESYPQNYNLDFKIGRCYLNMPYEKKKAIAFLEKASKHISSTYKEGNFKEYSAPVDAYFYLGDAYRINNQLDKAIEAYKLFKSKCSPEKYDIKLVDSQIGSCNRAKESMKNPIDFDEQNLGNDINTRYSETNPVVSQDESTLVYASKLPFYQAMFYSKKVNGKWQTPVNMIPELGVDGDCFPTSISYNGNELYIYRSNEYKGDIFVSYYVNGKWTKIKKLNGNINTKYWESHASISRDGKYLYFTSNRDGGYGGLDIYVSQRTSGDDWGPAQNLGATINSPFNEETPFIMPDGKTLYFSSYDHESIGGYDIFFSYRNDNNMWSKPVNVGFPINTTDDDFFFCPLRDGKIAYISRFDPNGAGRFDITRLNIYSNKNPRLYQVKAVAKIQNNNTRNLYMALYDKIKKDTILRKKYSDSNINFDAIPGQYEIYITSNGNQYEGIPFSIRYGSKDLSPEFDLNLILKTNNIQATQTTTTKTYAETKNVASTSTENTVVAKPNDLLSYEIPENSTLTENSNSDSINKNIAGSDSITKSVQTSAGKDNTKQIVKTAEHFTDNYKHNWFNKLFKNKITAVSGIVLISFLFLLIIILYKRRRNNKTK